LDGQTDDHPDVDRFDVGDARQRRLRTVARRRRRQHGQQTHSPPTTYLPTVFTAEMLISRDEHFGFGFGLGRGFDLGFEAERVRSVSRPEFSSRLRCQRHNIGPGLGIALKGLVVASVFSRIWSLSLSRC